MTQKRKRPDSISRRTLVRTALPRSLLTVSLRPDCTVGNGPDGLLWKIEKIHAVSAENNRQALPRTLTAPTIIRSSHRLRLRHHRHLLLCGRLPLHRLPRRALVEGAHWPSH